MNDKIFEAMLDDIMNRAEDTDDKFLNVAILLVTGTKVLTDTAEIEYFSGNGYITCVDDNDSTRFIPLSSIVTLAI